MFTTEARPLSRSIFLHFHTDLNGRSRISKDLCQKLHENERNWAEKVGGRVESLVPLGFANGSWQKIAK